MTEGAFGQLGFQGEFDPLDPANVAPVVVWLLSAAAADVSGQVIGITGGLVELYEGWHVVATEAPPPLDPRGAGRRRPRLFGDRPTRAPWRPSSLRRIIETARSRGGPRLGACCLIQRSAAAALGRGGTGVRSVCSPRSPPVASA